MVTKTLVPILVIGLFFSANVARVNAHDEADISADVSVRVNAGTNVNVGLSPAEIEARRREAKEAAEAKRAEVKANIDALRANTRASTGTDRADIRLRFDARRAEIKAHIEAEREAFKENAEERKEMREERRDDIAAHVAERAEARMQLHLDRFVRILNAAIERMYGFVDRIGVRADAMAAEGKDTAEARERLDLAVTELAAAESDLASIETDLEATLSVDVSALTRDVLRQAFHDTRAVVKSAQEHIRRAHKALRDAIVSLEAQAAVRADVEAETETEVEAEVE